MSIDANGIPRIYDTFGDFRIARAAKNMKVPIHLMEPQSIGRPEKAPATGVFATIADTIDVRVVTDLMIEFILLDQDQTNMRIKERQAVCEAGFRRLVELCNKRSQNQMRWIGEHNENLNTDHEQIRRVLHAMDTQSICYDIELGKKVRLANGEILDETKEAKVKGSDAKDEEEKIEVLEQGPGASSQNRGCEVACVSSLCICIIVIYSTRMIGLTLIFNIFNFF